LDVLGVDVPAPALTAVAPSLALELVKSSPERNAADLQSFAEGYFAR
jgi:hypothetical protein